MTKLKNIRNVWSEQACRAIAADLFAQAQRWENRAQEIQKYRGNIRPIEDPAPAMKAAIRVLTSVQNGMDPILECHRVCDLLFLDFRQVWQLYRHKLAAYEREVRTKRNRAMRTYHHKNPSASVRELGRIFGISHGQVSKILNHR